MQEQSVIQVEDLRKQYGPLTAVDGITFQVQAGEIFGMVGPNGSGKTTTIECIEGLRKPDEGSIRLLNLDPAKNIYKLRERIGVQLQSSSLPNRIRVEEALDLFSSFYQHTRDWRKLLDELGLAEKRRSIFSQLSGVCLQAEAEFIYANGARRILIGAGQSGVTRRSEIMFFYPGVPVRLNIGRHAPPGQTPALSFASRRSLPGSPDLLYAAVLLPGELPRSKPAELQQLSWLLRPRSGAAPHPVS